MQWVILSELNFESVCEKEDYYNICFVFVILIENEWMRIKMKVEDETKWVKEL